MGPPLLISIIRVEAISTVEAITNLEIIQTELEREWERERERLGLIFQVCGENRSIEPHRTTGIHTSTWYTEAIFLQTLPFDFFFSWSFLYDVCTSFFWAIYITLVSF